MCLYFFLLYRSLFEKAELLYLSISFTHSLYSKNLNMELIFQNNSYVVISYEKSYENWSFNLAESEKREKTVFHLTIGIYSEHKCTSQRINLYMTKIWDLIFFSLYVINVVFIFFHRIPPYWMTDWINY